MGFLEWVVIISIILIILLGAIGIGWFIRNRTDETPESQNKFLFPMVWSQPTSSTNPNKNTCKLYTFPTALVNISGVPTAVPGAPTFNNNILNNITGATGLPACLDTDQTVAREVVHTCVAPRGVVDGSITRCNLIDGGQTGLDGKETYYTNVGCPKIPACVGQVSLISVNFQAPTVSNSFCLKANGAGNLITMAPCNPSDQDQMFRITRTNPGQNPNTIKPGSGQNGFLAQIYHRQTGLCVVPSITETSTVYNPAYINPVNASCTGPTQTFTGPGLTLGPCTGGQYPGFIWGMLPSALYCGVSGGCHGCTGCSGCSRIRTGNACGGCVGCTGYEYTPVPPQITHIGDLVLPTNGYQGLTGYNATVKFLRDNRTLSMYYGGSGSGVILEPNVIDLNVCVQKPYTSQYLNIATYNTLKSIEVCLAQGISNAPYCISL